MMYVGRMMIHPRAPGKSRNNKLEVTTTNSSGTLAALSETTQFISM